MVYQVNHGIPGIPVRTSTRTPPCARLVYCQVRTVMCAFFTIHNTRTKKLVLRCCASLLPTLNFRWRWFWKSSTICSIPTSAAPAPAVAAPAEVAVVAIAAASAPAPAPAPPAAESTMVADTANRNSTRAKGHKLGSTLSHHKQQSQGIMRGASLCP